MRSRLVGMVGAVPYPMHALLRHLTEGSRLQTPLRRISSSRSGDSLDLSFGEERVKERCDGFEILAIHDLFVDAAETIEECCMTDDRGLTALGIAR